MMKRAPITLFRREAYGLVLEEHEREPLPRRSEPPTSEAGRAAGREGGNARPEALDLALLAALAVGGVGFWILVGKLLFRAWALLLSLLN